MKAQLSIMGLYNYYPSLLDNLELPKGIDRNLIVNLLLIRSADLEVLYPQPEVMKSYLGLYSLSRIDIWTKLYNTTKLEYNPISNYDREETTTRTEQRKTKGKNTATSNGTDTHNRTEDRNLRSSESEDVTVNSRGKSNGTTSDTTEGSTTSEVSKSAYNAASTYSPVDKTVENTQNTADRVTSASTEGSDITSGTKSGSDTGKITTDESIRKQVNDTSSNESEEGSNITEIGRVRGNIGVTTTQQMIQQEREIANFSIYDYIVDDIISAVCLLVY